MTRTAKTIERLLELLFFLSVQARFFIKIKFIIKSIKITRTKKKADLKRPLAMLSIIGWLNRIPVSRSMK